MYTELNKWANCPISLSENEMNDPYSVIDDFFSADDLSGHLERLKKWRDRVIGNGYYTDLKGSPSSLIWRHELNVKLVECVAVLLQSSDLTASIDISALDAKENNRELALIRTTLNESEIANPLLVVSAFFQERPVGWYREQLQEWLRYGLSASAAREFVNSPDLTIVYENLQKLYAAVWLLLMAHEQLLSDSEQREESPVSNVHLYTLDTDIIPLHQKVFPDLVSVIKTKLPSTCAIYYLGTAPGKFDSAFLLVLTADHEQGEALSLGNILEESCRPEQVTILVHYASAVINAVNIGDHFFSRALSCPALFVSGELLLPNANLLGKGLNLALSEGNWERWLKQGKEFLSGTEYYLSVQAYSAALFSLQQGAECILIAIVRAVLGYKINSHNLLRLLRVTQFFTNDLAAIFYLDTQEGKRNFNILKEAYISVRYRDNYQPDGDTVEALYPVVSKLLSTTEQVHHQFLLMNTL